MFDTFEVKSSFNDYSVISGSVEVDLPGILQDGDVVLLDQYVGKLFPELASLVVEHLVIPIEANEESKTYHSIGNVIDQLIAANFSKNQRLVAIGGGVTQDITSFIASIMFRGVDWLFVPTSLLAQCDSCIGSKNSINFGEFKNQLGGFWPPRVILLDERFHRTLTNSEIASGLGEMMHYFLVDNVDDLAKLRSELLDVIEDRSKLPELISRSLKIKKAMIERDEFDRGPRNVFNYGHSFGHALEATTDHLVPHGIAVAYGMDLANVVSAELGLIDWQTRNSIREVLEVVWAEMALPEIDINRYYSALSKDKKNVGDTFVVILTRGIGDMFKTKLDRTPEVEQRIEDFFNKQLYKEAI